MTTDTRLRPRSSRWTRRAWFAVGFMPVALVLSMLTGQALFASLGYETEDTDVPLGAIVLAGGTTLLMLMVPWLAAWHLGRRALAAGERRGRSPAFAGAVVGAVFLGLHLIGLLGRL